MKDGVLKFIVSAQVERQGTKNETRAVVEEEIRMQLEDDNAPDAIFGPNGGEYKITSWIVTTE